MSRVGVAVAVATLALAVSACGGSSASISRLRAHATAICQRAAAQSDGITAPALPSQTAAFLRRGAAVLAPELAELRTLSPPTDEANVYSGALDAESRQLTTLEGTIHDLDRGADPLTVIKPLERRLAPAESADNAAWHTLDIPACVTR
jgi:hypothetical protein